MVSGLQQLLTASSTAAAGQPPAALLASVQGQITDYLVQSNMFIAAGGIYMIPKVIGATPFGKKILSNQWVVRFMPLYPIVAAAIAVALPGAVDLPDRQIGTLVMAAAWIAGIVSVGHKIIGQTILGDDPRIETLAVKSLGQYEAVIKKPESN